MQDPDCPGSPDEGYYPEMKDPQDEAEWQTKEDTEMAEWCGVEPETETVGESQEEEAEPPKEKTSTYPTNTKARDIQRLCTIW